MRRNLLPSVEIEKEIDALLAGERVDVHPLEVVSELGKLGVRLVLQRAVEDEVDDWLGRARYERRAEAAPGKRNGYRPRRLQTGEGEIVVELPQVRDACAPFTSRLFRRRKRFLATEPLQALVIGAFVRGLSMRDVESLCQEAGLGQVSRSTASRLCRELKERFRAFRERDLSELRLVCLFLDAIYLPTRPSGAKEGVLCAWGISEDGERVLLEVSLGMREAEEDWTSLGRSLTRRGLKAPLLIVADGAPDSSTRSSSSGRTRTVSAARSIASGTSSPSCPSESANGSRPPTGAPSTRPARSKRASVGCGRWSASSPTRVTPLRPPASPTTWRRSPSTCATRSSTGASGGRRTCSSGASARSSAGRR